MHFPKIVPFNKTRPVPLLRVYFGGVITVPVSDRNPNWPTATCPVPRGGTNRGMSKHYTSGRALRSAFDGWFGPGLCEEEGTADPIVLNNPTPPPPGSLERGYTGTFLTFSLWPLVRVTFTS